MSDTSPPTEPPDGSPRELDQRLRYVARLETVGQLAAGFAHELGTPLNVVLGRARMISRRQVEGDAAVECADIIIEQARRMTELVRALLTFARSRPSPTDRLEIGGVVERACRLLTPIAHKRRIDFVIEKDDETRRVRGDSGALQQVLANIVMNSLDAMPQGGEVHLSTVTEDRAHPDSGVEQAWYGIRVVDRGPGVPPELRERVFDPFFTTKDVGAGTGLGLSVAYGIVRDHAGWIAIDDADPGPGAAITIWLPPST